MLFHGTTIESAAKIAAEGFKPSVTGVYGAGVYATDRPATAASYGRERTLGSAEYAVIGCRVRLQRKVDAVVWGGIVCVRDPLRVLPVCIFYLERFVPDGRRPHALVRA